MDKLDLNVFKARVDPYLFVKKSELERAAIQGRHSEVLFLIQSGVPLTFSVLNNLFKRKEYDFAIQLGLTNEDKFVRIVVYLCIYYNQLDLLKKIEQVKFDTSDYDNKGLIAASKNGHLLMVAYLIEMGGDLNISFEHGTSEIKAWSKKMIDAKNLHQSLNDSLSSTNNNNESHKINENKKTKL